MQTVLRWLLFLGLLLPLLFLVGWNMDATLQDWARSFCPVGFWRKPLLFGAAYCAWAPVSIAIHMTTFTVAMLASLLWTRVLPATRQGPAIRALLLLWLILPQLNLLKQDHFGWENLGMLVVAAALWAGFAGLHLLRKPTLAT